jgi:hypothetical protein
MFFLLSRDRIFEFKCKNLSPFVVTNELTCYMQFFVCLSLEHSPSSEYVGLTQRSYLQTFTLSAFCILS